MTVRKIDHIVYSVIDLEKTIYLFEKEIGIKPIFAGYHKRQGTKNALINLGNDCYFEILSIDKENKNVKSPRWMGIDLISQPRITRWAIKTNCIETDRNILSCYNNDLSEIFIGSRKTTNEEILSWKMTLPLPHPKIELVPFVLDWSDSAFHPTEKLKDVCKIKKIEFASKNPKEIESIFNKLDIPYKVSFSNQDMISTTLEGPKGTIEII